ncbi:MAG TPA: flagellar motor protein MotB [Oscillospiraceae bacterium]|nr:flagellar motor protein MotB [Oscillospiraceae bacterium]
MSRKRQVNQEEPQSGAPAWMTTFADMTTLLLCFFVLLFSFSTIDAQKFQSMIQSFQGSLGILDSGGTSIEIDDFITDTMEDEIAAAQKQETENFMKLQRVLEEYLAIYDLESDVLVTHENVGLILRFKDNVLFDSGKADLKPRSKEILKDISKFLQSEEFIKKSIRIEGHTDTVKVIPNLLYPTNWELSTGRASNVTRYLIEELGLAPERFSISGYGEYHPIAPNDTAENKSKNRRVDIVILRSTYNSPGSE